jgi:UDP-N-acetylglucosamine/UDP-N-acetylgalactosamine diphosphorylase
MTVPPELLARLRAHGQEHLLLGWESLTAAERDELVKHLTRIDFAELDSLRRQAALPPPPLPENIAPVPITPPTYTPEERARGVEALRRGEVAALLVAGGQGSRLGALQPKGMFPAAPVTGATLYQLHAEKVLALSRRYGFPVPLLVMTSPATDEQTQAFFEEQGNFGLGKDQVTFFRQGTMPAVCPQSGRLLLEAHGKLFLSPDGHGGTLTALAGAGLLDELDSRGVRHVFYFQVDNPLVKVCDPGFVGRHVATRSEVSSKVVAKEHPEEKVGVLVESEGRCVIVEYTMLPRHLAEEREPTGELRIRAGSPAIHVFGVEFLRRVTQVGALPFRTALKAVKHFDPHAGRHVEPGGEPNAIKFERFIFDALPHAERWLTVETPRAEEFAPIKNATGPDSPETARAAQVRLYTEWLRRIGVDPGEHPVEVSPLFALDPDELADKIARDLKVSGPTVFK